MRQVVTEASLGTRQARDFELVDGLAPEDLGLEIHYTGVGDPSYNIEEIEAIGPIKSIVSA